jgi:DNA polymerase-3 subunit epsilon|tara:strand:- start:5025 stop:5870 length:846 start_codon:yes stop_codon:yes gene_type:complete
LKHLVTEGANTVTLQKFEKLDPPSCERSPDDLMVVFLDVETTGLSFDSDRVIQLCVRPALVNKDTYEFAAIAKSKVYHNDPGFPLSEEIKSLTNISDSDIAGEKIDWEWVSSTLERADFVVCHNASFDRGMIESELIRASLKTTESIWACSMSQVFWRDFCRPSRALEVLCAWSGFFYDSHQAANDVDAMIHVLRRNKKTGEMLQAATLPDYRVFAMNSPREKNVELKKRRYRWDPNVSCWYKNFGKNDSAVNELEWLKSLDDSVDPQMFEIDAKYRFSPE